MQCSRNLSDPGLDSHAYISGHIKNIYYMYQIDKTDDSLDI
jgi:hypothetical protein